MNEEWLKEAERLADAYAKRRATVTQLLVVNSENGLAQFARVSEDVARSALMSHLARAAVPAVQPPEFREVSWGVNSTMRPCKGMAVSEYAFRQWAEANGIALAAPQVEARQEPKPDSSYPAQPSGEAATARDAGAMWDRFIAHLNECDSIEHVNLLGGVAKYRQAFIYAALSSTPTQGDDGNAGVRAVAPLAWERRQGLRCRDGWSWSTWQPCTEAEAQRVTGLHSWQVRQTGKCPACAGTGRVPSGVKGPEHD